MLKQLAVAVTGGVNKLKKVPYWYLLAVPSLTFYLGVGLNQLALVANHNQMPVDLPASLWDVCADPVHAFAQADDTVHSCMTPKTHLKFLCDWIVIGNPNPDYIMSPGDCFIFLYEAFVPFVYYLWIALMIRDFYGGNGEVVQAQISNSGSRAAQASPSGPARAS